MSEGHRIMAAVMVCLFPFSHLVAVQSSTCQVVTNEENMVFFVHCTDGARLTLTKTEDPCPGEGFEKGAWVTLVYGDEEAVMISRFNRTCKLRVVLGPRGSKGERVTIGERGDL